MRVAQVYGHMNFIAYSLIVTVYGQLNKPVQCAGTIDTTSLSSFAVFVPTLTVIGVRRSAVTLDIVFVSQYGVAVCGQPSPAVCGRSLDLYVGTSSSLIVVSVVGRRRPQAMLLWI